MRSRDMSRKNSKITIIIYNSKKKEKRKKPGCIDKLKIQKQHGI